MARPYRYIMNLFSPEGGLYKFISRLFDLIKLNFLWLLFSLPIVTIGPATVAAYDVIMRMADDEEGYIGKGFVRAFKANFKSGLPIGILALVLLEAINIDFQFFEIYRKQGEGEVKFLVIGILTVIFFFVFTMYAFPLSARYENTFLHTIGNSSTIFQRKLGKSILLMISVLIEIVLFIFSTTTMIIGVVIGPASVFYTIGLSAKRIFQEIEEDPSTVKNQPPEKDSWGDDANYSAAEGRRKRQKKAEERSKGIWQRANGNQGKK